MSHHIKSDGSRSFGIIEMSIFITVFTITISGYILFLINNAKLSLTRNSVSTQSNIDFVSKTMMNYFSVNKNLPCPADPTLRISDPNFGVEYFDSTGTGCAGQLLTAKGGTNPAWPVPFRNQDHGIAVGGIQYTHFLWGAIPTKALGISNKYALDPSGNKLSYIIHESFANFNKHTSMRYQDSIGYSLTNISQSAPATTGTLVQNNSTCTSNNTFALFGYSEALGTGCSPICTRLGNSGTGGSCTVSTCSSCISSISLCNSRCNINYNKTRCNKCIARYCSTQCTGCTCSNGTCTGGTNVAVSPYCTTCTTQYDNVNRIIFNTCNAQIMSADTNTILTGTQNTIAYIIINHGNNGYGAWNQYGAYNALSTNAYELANSYKNYITSGGIINTTNYNFNPTSFPSNIPLKLYSGSSSTTFDDTLLYVTTKDLLNYSKISERVFCHPTMLIQFGTIPSNTNYQQIDDTTSPITVGGSIRSCNPNGIWQ